MQKIKRNSKIIIDLEKKNLFTLNCATKIFSDVTFSI